MGVLLVVMFSPTASSKSIRAGAGHRLATVWMRKGVSRYARAGGPFEWRLRCGGPLFGAVHFNAHVNIFVVIETKISIEHSIMCVYLGDRSRDDA
jgi:hypothetical protein